MRRFADVEHQLEQAIVDRQAAMKLKGIVDDDAFVAEVRERQQLIDRLRDELGALHAANPALRDLARGVEEPAVGETLRRADIRQVIDYVVVRPARGDGRRLLIDERCIVVPRGMRPAFVADHYRPTERRAFPVQAWLEQHGSGHASSSPDERAQAA